MKPYPQATPRGCSTGLSSSAAPAGRRAITEALYPAAPACAPRQPALLPARGFGKSARGQSTAEFALVLPLLLLLVVGAFWSSELVQAYNFVSYAAQAAARYAIVRGATSPQPTTANDITSFVTSMAVGLNPKDLTVNTTWTPNNQPGATVAVQVQYVFQLNLPFMPSSALTLSATSTLPVSQ